MKHGRKVPKLQRDASHRKALLANLTCALIEHRRIRTTLAKAKALRPYAEKLVTLGKRGDLHARRLAVGTLHSKAMVKKLFEEIAVASKDRAGGYTRITKLGQRRSDSAPMAYIEWVDAYVPATVKEETVQPATAEAAA
ncbi:MAG TPA: 50S ribosomal protein L17 [Verrucomicrobiales bacterium]|nr:50S ribosomal protein L17 [Verrucomicrobiales bacterium]